MLGRSHAFTLFALILANAFLCDVAVSAPKAGKWSGEITNEYKGHQFISFVVSADGSRLENVSFKGYWHCKSALSSSTELQDLVNLDPPGVFTIRDGQFSEVKRVEKSRLWWEFTGRFTSPTEAEGTYKVAYAGTECATYSLKWTARPSK